MLIKDMGSVGNFIGLFTQVKNLVSQYGTEHRQIMCQTREDGKEDWYTGTGRVEELEFKDEREYKYVQPTLRNTHISTIIDHLKGFRARIMIMPPKTCYSIHQDATPRVHIPIVTNLNNLIIFPSDNQMYSLIPGKAMWLDTRRPHTFINGDNLLTRIHLVMCVEE